MIILPHISWNKYKFLNEVVTREENIGCIPPPQVFLVFTLESICLSLFWIFLILLLKCTFLCTRLEHFWWADCGCGRIHVALSTQLLNSCQGPEKGNLNLYNIENVKLYIVQSPEGKWFPDPPFCFSSGCTKNWFIISQSAHWTFQSKYQKASDAAYLAGQPENLITLSFYLIYHLLATALVFPPKKI